VREFTPVSATELAQRRQKLRRQRGLKVVQSVWRTVLVSGLAVGLGWGITRPLLLIRGPQQVSITGNEFLSAEVLRALLPLDYPISLFQVQPERLAEVLETRAPIATATVNRQLFPPELTIQVQERRPVARATNQVLTGPNAPQGGFLDEKGLWIPAEVITNLDADLELPTLVVSGFRAEYQKDWPQVYQLVKSSPVAVSAIDWQDPNNLILQTELGTVHCGLNRVVLSQQLTVLDQMRNLSQDPEFANIEFIDLRDPDKPILRVKNTLVSAPPAQETGHEVVHAVSAD
jgi:cell division protein FtsQ